MHNFNFIESCFKKFIEDIPRWLPEDIVHVDINLLHRFGLLHYHDSDETESALTRYFHVVESNEKITLINDTFVIWIVPEKQNETPVTYTLVALNNEKEPALEVCFVTSGVYNTSKLVLRVLEKFLGDIEENEAMLKNLKKGPDKPDDTKGKVA